jgi:hypothetical protein
MLNPAGVSIDHHHPGIAALPGRMLSDQFIRKIKIKLVRSHSAELTPDSMPNAMDL